MSQSELPALAETCNIRTSRFGAFFQVPLNQHVFFTIKKAFSTKNTHLQAGGS